MTFLNLTPSIWSTKMVFSRLKMSSAGADNRLSSSIQ
jgi:hypothetical protein